MTGTHIKAKGKLLTSLHLSYNGFKLPVTVYTAVLPEGKAFALCICFENTPIETRLYLDKDKSDRWIELYEGDIELARLIGPMIEHHIKPIIYN